MKLLKVDKDSLRKAGYSDFEIRQIEKATGVTVYKLNNKERISTKRAIELLGRAGYFNGMVRCTFHRTAIREVPNTKDIVFFDASRLFR